MSLHKIVNLYRVAFISYNSIYQLTTCSDINLPYLSLQPSMSPSKYFIYPSATFHVSLQVFYISICNLPCLPPSILYIHLQPSMSPSKYFIYPSATFHVFLCNLLYLPLQPSMSLYTTFSKFVGKIQHILMTSCSYLICCTCHKRVPSC